MPRKQERRRRRSINTTQALCYQLDMCRRKAGLQGIVLSDEDGVCLAAAGDTDVCDEVAARLPLMGSRVETFEGVLFSRDDAVDVQMQRFAVYGSELYVCAIGGDPIRRRTQVDHTVRGASRILTPHA